MKSSRARVLRCLGSPARLEELKIRPDFYVTRATASMSDLNSWTKGQSPLVALKGGDLVEEMQPFPKVQLVPIKNYFDEEFFDTKVIAYLA